MSITSLTFAGFFILVLALYYLLPRRAQNGLLLAASYGFYASWSWVFPLVLLLLTGLTYACGVRLRAIRKRPKAAQAESRWYLWSGIGLNILVLAGFKYADFFLPEMTRLLQALRLETLSSAARVLMPVGLSYRVLENISFLVDASRGQFPARPGLVDFALYSAYFPKLLSGPIERARAFLPKLAQDRIVDNGWVERGVALLTIGAFRKLVVADTIAGLLPAGVFEKPLDYTAAELLFWLLLQTTVIYNDFAGYTDMVRGVSCFFGIELSRNFINPMFSRSFAEAWSRWHITLSMWLRDYIYLPVSRVILRRNPNPRSFLYLVLPPLAAMVVSAAWHQLSLNMLLWGVLIGLYLVSERIPQLWRPPIAPDKRPKWRQILSMWRVSGLFLLSLILFRMNLATGRQFIENLFAPSRWSIPSLTAVLLVCVAFLFDHLQHRTGEELFFLKWPRLAQSAILALALLVIFIATRFSPATTFVYQGF